MKKNEAWVRIGSALFAAMLSYLVLNIIVNEMSLVWKVVIICVVGLIAFVIAFWAGKKPVQTEEQQQRTIIGKDIISKGGVTLEDVEIKKKLCGDVIVGKDISAEKDVQIQGIHVDSKG